MILYYANVAILLKPFLDLPWNFHAYFGLQIAMLSCIMAARWHQIAFLANNEHREGRMEQIQWRVLKYDFLRSLCFTVDIPLTFALFRAYEFLRYTAGKNQAIFNWGLISYFIFCCFIGGCYIILVAADAWNQMKTLR